MHTSIDWLRGSDKRPRRTFAHPPRAVPWEKTLPWAKVIISQTAGADDLAHVFACAKAVAAPFNHDGGTSVTAKTPNACVCYGAGRPSGARPSGGKMRRPKPSTPRPNGCAGS